MSKQPRKRKKRLAHTMRTVLVSVLVVAFFALPAFMTVRWVKTIVFGPDDPRKATPVAPLQVRPYDKQHAAIKPFDEPIVSITFDDGWENIYSKAVPILQEEGFLTTQYLIGGVFNNPLYMSVAQVKTMQKAGHEIGSHSMTHSNLTMLADANLRWELSETRTVLEKNFGATVKDFASPLGAANSHTLEAIAQAYRSHRNTKGDPKIAVNELDVNIKDKWDLYNINAYSVRTTTTLEDIQKLVDYAVANNGWLVLVYHQVDENVELNGEEFGVTPDELRQQLEVVSSRPIRSATVGQVLDTYERQYKTQAR